MRFPASPAALTPRLCAPIFTLMFQAFTRIMLALVMAFTFAGQMEAAAAHCAQLARSEAITAEGPTAELEQPDCHGMADAKPADHSLPAEMPEAPTPDHCECIAALKVFAAPAALPGSARIAPYAWLIAAEAQFASIAPAPGLRPPRV